VKRASTFAERRQQGNAAALPVRATPPRPVLDRKLLAMPDLDEGPDAAFREVIERITRGDRIRGHAL